ncbi:putative uncharacterized protein [Bacteroides sp. CAG:927]|jgi:hypothetical protein|nr:putative uncharacterized protein [Bacteroides sp. CAG:927]
MKPEYLQLAHEAYLAGADLRERRCRYKRYTYGAQWDDPVVGPTGEVMTEGELATANGNRPLTNNMIRQMVKCVVGNFRNSMHDAQPQGVNVDEEVAMRNALDELDCRLLEEFLISGCAIQRIVAEHRMGGCGVWVDNVSPDEFFVNAYRDVRGHDIELVGMLHGMSRRELLMRFGGVSGAKAMWLNGLYDRLQSGGAPELGKDAGSDFYTASPGRCRVIEVWTLESRNIVKCHDRMNASVFNIAPRDAATVRKINAERAKAGTEAIEMCARTTMRWHCRFYAPGGELLDEYDSPYGHGMHPFMVKMYPLIDGEVHSFVEDVVDQQRYINRLITLMDHVLGSSAKGVLLFPVDQKPDGLSWRELGALWANTNSVIPYYRTGNGVEPRQVVNSGEHTGAHQLLDIELKLLQQISGVSGALQGQLGRGDSSAALYEAQTRNAAVALRDLLDTFHSFRQLRNRKIAQTMS